MKKPELLAPAGSMESITAALRCGADAVYVGGKAFSARQNAANFDFNELKEIADLCHLYGKKLYMTVNTIIFDRQTTEFVKTIENALNCNIDAFIVQDLGAAEIIKSISSDAKLHASTQMTIHSPSGAITAKKLGFKRVVLSRELTRKQIKEISALDIETEIFVHGALCMSVSGQCYLSALIGQRSANRGLCAQPCRLPFFAGKNSNYCGLSLKDLSLINYIKEFENSGMTSLKIEGRMKRPEYVAATVSAFRNAIDGKDYDCNSLHAVFSRSGFTDGYFTGKNTNMFGMRVKEDVTATKDVLPSLRQLYKNESKISDIHFSAKICKDSPVMLSASDDAGHTIKVFGECPQIAQHKPVSKELLERQLSKLGDTIYNYVDVDAVIDDGLAVSAKDLNVIRRKAVLELDLARISANSHKYEISRNLPEIKNCDKNISTLRARISDLSQLKAIENADFVILPLEIFSSDITINLEKIIIEPPRFIANEDDIIKQLENIKKLGVNHMMCNNVAYLQIGSELGFTLHGDFGLNISNSYSANLLTNLGVSDLTLSFEMKLGQISAVKSPVETGIIAYGRLPVMLTKNCPVKNEIGCGKCKKIITDRTKRTFYIDCHADYTEILNSQKLYLADRIDEIKNISFMTLYFTDETPSEITSVIHAYRYGGNKKENITRGLYYRGII